MQMSCLFSGNAKCHLDSRQCFVSWCAAIRSHQLTLRIHFRLLFTTHEFASIYSVRSRFSQSHFQVWLLYGWNNKLSWVVLFFLYLLGGFCHCGVCSYFHILNGTSLIQTLYEFETLFPWLHARKTLVFAKCGCSQTVSQSVIHEWEWRQWKGGRE